MRMVKIIRTYQKRLATERYSFSILTWPVTEEDLKAFFVEIGERYGSSTAPLMILLQSSDGFGLGLIVLPKHSHTFMVRASL